MNNLQRITILKQYCSIYNSKIRRLNGLLHIISTSRTTNRYVYTNESVPTYTLKNFKKMLAKKFTFLDIPKSRLKVIAYIQYETIVDHIHYSEMFKSLNLSDTFYSWFAVTELYIWMLMVRYMAEGEDGQFIRNYIVEVLWLDVNHRVKKLGAVNPAAIRVQVSELSDQLRAAIVAYDEGLQSSDVILAGALWRRLYQMETVDPECLDILVKFIRQQIKLLDNMTHQELFNQDPIKWERLKI